MSAPGVSPIRPGRMKVILPPGVEEPAWHCNICGKPFFRDERSARERHTATCAAEHHDELVAEQQRRQPDALFRAHDPEFEAYTKISRRH